MAARIKHHILSQISRSLQEQYKITASSFITPHTKTSKEFSILLQNENSKLLESIQQEFSSKKSAHINNIEKFESEKSRGLIFNIDKNFYAKSVVESILNPELKNENPKKIIVEFSSPNIAKPFHVGHLRSTIVGNFISNINIYLKNNVIKLNYLGDWGTQFGMLKIGVDVCAFTDKEIKANPIQLLYEAYVTANKLAEKDATLNTKAREEFNKLENGDTESIKRWNLYKEYTMEELKSIYNRIGIVFDEYHWESMYGSNVVNKLLNGLESKGIVSTDESGKKIVKVNDRNISIAKSDGSSLYLSRDLAAVVDRFNKYSFDEMVYVVDNAQMDHFFGLFGVLGQMGSPCAGFCRHVKFGRIRGMSTRKGTTVFLKDILDEAKEKMRRQQMESGTTKVSPSDEATTDILGMTAVIINDLKQRRQKDYEFSWERALQAHGDSGIRLQYLHCRLWSIEQNCGVKIPEHCNPDLLQEPEATSLIRELSRFDDVIEKAHAEMEACVLVVYLFGLSTLVNKAVKVLQVKDQHVDLAGQRLLLFHAARIVIKTSLEILGVRPLNQM